VSHLRSYYRWASHEVHADAQGLAHNVIERGGVEYLHTGRINIGIADPGQMALISLQQITSTLLLSGDAPAPRDIYAMHAVNLLVDKACDAFAAAEEAVAAGEERYQAKQTARGAR
jgi:hypothetical protein